LRISYRQEFMELLPWLIGVYIFICVGAYFGNRLFMYFPDPSRFTPSELGLDGVEEVELKTGDGETLICWYAQAKPGKPTILYFHGNAANAANRAPKYDKMREQGAGVFYMNNRGYGGSTGSPTEAHNVADAVTAYDHLRSFGIPASDIVLYGESLGSGQATQLAAKREVKAVVLEAPLTSTVHVGRRTWFFLPLGLLMTDKFANIEHVKNVHAPLLVLHGERDGVIPVQMGKDVFAAANEPKKLELFPEAEHSDLFDHGAWETTWSFISGLPKRN
jgi:fermentation-respiration switch protein FrsA (DUF1100 family)